jgi:Zn-finger nucleic acid-binding protein
MKCPTCRDTTLVMSDRQGIEIDYCPDCRGVWLDRGELDKIIERTVAMSGPAPAAVAAPAAPAPGPPVAAPAPASAQQRWDDDWDDGWDGDGPGGKGKKKKRRSSLLEELFDFG